MNEIIVNVKFAKGRVYRKGISLKTNDYNSTKIKFEFDREDGTKIFELKNPNGETIFVDEIVNNEIILTRFDEHEVAYPLFTEAGEYTFEISLYKNNSKLTSASSFLIVEQEEVIVDGEIVETYTPMFDNLLSDLSSALEQSSNIDIDAEQTSSGAIVKITNRNGEEKTVTIEGGSGGTSDYSDLTNKPKINNVELVGNKSLNDLGIQPKGNYIIDNNYVHTDNNYTIEEKNKLSSLSNYDNTEIRNTLINKADKSEIPDVSNFITKTVNDLANYYLKSETYTKTEVNTLIGQISTLQFQVVSELPQTGDSKYFYLVPSSNPKTKNVKDEYIWTNNAWEQIGSTQVDLTGYATESWVNTQISNFLTENEINTLISTALNGYARTSDIPTNLSDLTGDSTHRVVTDTEKATWNAKGTYSKPNGGIPKTDLASAVQTSLGKADSALQSHQDISGKEDKSNKVTSISSSSTNTQYPSAKAVYDLFNSITDGDEVLY